MGIVCTMGSFFYLPIIPIIPILPIIPIILITHYSLNSLVARVFEEVGAVCCCHSELVAAVVLNG